MALKILRICCSPASSPRLPDSRWSWLVCLAGSVTWAFSFGITQCYAVLMPVIMDHFKSSREATAWAGSIPTSLAFATIPLCSKVIDRIDIRYGALLGAVMCAASLLLTSFATRLVHVFFSYSIIYGVGCSMIYTSSIVAVTRYFKKRQGIAIGVLTGSLNVGVLSLGPLLQLMVDAYGLSRLFRILACPFAVIVLLLLTFDPNVKKPTLITVGEDEESEEEKVAFCAGLREVFKRPQYVIAIVSLMLQTLTAFVSYVHLISYCQEVGIPPSKASNLFIAIGLSSLCSSLIAGRVVDIHSINPLHISQVGSLSMALSMLLLQLATEYYHFVIYSVFLGFGIGILVTIIVLLMLRTVEPRLRSVSFPFGQMCTSLGNLTGPPLIGFIADQTGSYKPAFFAAGGICLLAFFLPFLQYCFKPWMEEVKSHEIHLDPSPESPRTQRPSGAIPQNPATVNEEEESLLLAEYQTTVPEASESSEKTPLNPASGNEEEEPLKKEPLETNSTEANDPSEATPLNPTQGKEEEPLKMGEPLEENDGSSETTPLTDPVQGKEEEPLKMEEPLEENDGSSETTPLTDPVQGKEEEPLKMEEPLEENDGSSETTPLNPTHSGNEEEGPL